MTQKSKTLDCFKDYKAFAEKHTFNTLLSVQGPEYKDAASKLVEHSFFFKALCSENGSGYLSFASKPF